jgi:hypothetical protein
MSVGDKDPVLKAVAMDKTGVVRITHDGTLHTLKRPKWGQYRQLRDELKDLAPLDQERVALARIAQNEATPESEQVTAVEKLLDLTDQLAVAKSSLLRLMFNGHPGDPEAGVKPFTPLADSPLPEDTDDWETWLLADEELIPKLMEHWRQVPLVPGARASG